MYQYKLSESNVSNRVLYLWCVQSNGTSPAQFEAGGQPTMSVGGLPVWNSAGTLISVNTTVGEYAVLLGTSDISVLGPGVLRYSSGTALETSVQLQIVAFDPYDATKLGLTSISTFDSSVLSVTVSAMNKSVGATSGLSFAPAPGTYSATSLKIIAGDYSSIVTMGVGNMDKAVGAISGLSFVPAPGSFSATSVSVVQMDKAVGATSGLSFILSPAGYNAAADALLARDVMGGASSTRSVGQALAVLRNKVAIGGSTITVFQADDTTSMWTGSVSTVDPALGTLSAIDPK